MVLYVYLVDLVHNIHLMANFNSQNCSGFYEHHKMWVPVVNIRKVVLTRIFMEFYEYRVTFMRYERLECFKIVCAIKLSMLVE